MEAAQHSIIKAVSRKNESDCDGQRGANACNRIWILKDV